MVHSPELKKAVFKIHTFLENFDSNPDPATPGLRAPIELHTNKKWRSFLTVCLSCRDIFVINFCWFFFSWRGWGEGRGGTNFVQCSGRLKEIRLLRNWKFRQKNLKSQKIQSWAPASAFAPLRWNNLRAQLWWNWFTQKLEKIKKLRQQT